MIEIRKNQDRGTSKTTWLESLHTFSFGSYYDPAFTNFGALRVINEDHVKPGSGFSAHSHQDMEIISYVLEGALEHKDSLGTGSIIWPGEVQLMSAGTGITHSEFNPAHDMPVHFLQIWITPQQKGLTPAYQQANFQGVRKTGQLTLVVSPEGEGASLTIHQDVNVYVLDLIADQSFTYLLKASRMAWVQAARGKISLNGHELQQGDGAAVRMDEESLHFIAHENAEILLFDLVKTL